MTDATTKEDRAFAEWWTAQGNKIPKSLTMVMTMGKKVQDAEEKAAVLRKEYEEARADERRFRDIRRGWLAARGIDNP